MIRALQKLPVGQRRIVFVLLILGGILLIGAITLLLFRLTSGRTQSVALVSEVTIREFVTLPDNDAFPATVAAAPDGMVYTGSFATGAVWVITPEGVVSEIPNTRATIGGVSGIAVAPGGAILILDQGDTDPRTSGGAIWQLDPQGSVTPYGDIADERGFVAPNDIVFDSNGAYYITDSGRNEVWRFTVNEGETSIGALWWSPPTPTSGRSSITGLAFDPVNHAILVTDPETNMIYRVPIIEEAAGDFEIIYQHGERPDPPGFDGLTVTPDGVIYVAAFGQNGIARLDVENNALDYIAGLFRGSSDVEFSAPNLLYVPNFDQTSLVIPFTAPALPFGIDVITLP
jgi:sugar lactone lactonase YvrE